MVLHFRCLSFLEIIKDATSGRASSSDFRTANSTFDSRGTGPTPNPQNGLKVRSNTLKVFTLAELKSATQNFHASCMIGKGGFGEVHKCTVKTSQHSSNKIDVAVKRIKRGQKGYKTWETEVDVLGKIKHPKLVKLIGYCDEDDGNGNNCLLVYEYMPKRSLDVYLAADSATHLPWLRRLKIAQDAAIGLTYLHENEIIFRDFKPSNILLDDEWNAKLSDFGFARNGPQDGRTHISTALVGTKGYAAPEYVQTGRLTFKIDVWSYGIFLEELITGQRPITQNNSEKNPHFLRWLCCYTGAEKSNPQVDPRLAGNYSEKSMEKLKFIANKCLAKEPKARPLMSEVLEMVKEAIELEEQQLLIARQTPLR